MRNRWKDDPAKLEVDLKIITELTVLGVFTDKCGLSLIHHEMKSLLESDKAEHAHVKEVYSIVKNIGEDIVGIVPQRIRALCQQFNRELPVQSGTPWNLFNKSSIEYIYILNL